LTKLLTKLQKICASLLAIALLAGQLPLTRAATLSIGSDSLANPAVGETSAHSIAFTTQSNLAAGDTLELSFPDFGFALDSVEDIIVPVGPVGTVTYSNADKKITFTLSQSFPAGAVEVAISNGGITNPAVAGEYSVRILTKNTNGAVLDSGSALAQIANGVQVLANVTPVITNVTSSVSDGNYLIDQIIPIQVQFTGNVFVTGTPTLALNNGGTAFYYSGSGTSTLTFRYQIQANQNLATGGNLDYASTTALTLGTTGTIKLASGKDANLLLPSPGTTSSLDANKNIGISTSQFQLSVTAPTALSFEIADDNGATTTATPLLKFSAKIESGKVALSCDGRTWSNWHTYPESGQLNADGAADFNILSCGSDEGLKTISIKFANSFGYESKILTDSTIYKKTTTKVTETPPTTPSEVPTVVPTTGAATETKTTQTTVDLSTAITETKTNTKANEQKIIEVGYVDPNSNIWKSFRDVTVDTNGKTTVAAPNENKIEVRVIPAKKLENQTTSLTTSQPILPQAGGKIPTSTELVSTTNSATVQISAETNVTSGGSGASSSQYEGVIYAPEVVENPPPITDTNLEINNAIAVGSSSGSIQFDQPVLLTLPTENKKDPRIYYFDETTNDWVKTADVKGGKSGGEVSPDGSTISVWVDHMTLFAVVGVKEIKLVGISKIAVGEGESRRAEFASGEWFSPADIGNDDFVSIAWSGVGEKFYYTLDKNPAATSLRKITNETKFTTDFFVDGIRVSEGESYFHIRAEGADGERDGETVFVVNYDKTPPRLTRIKNEAGKIELDFSEPISSSDVISIYFADGRELEIPAIIEPTTILEINSDETAPQITAIVGLLTDHAGLVLINPSPDANEIADGQIHAASVEVLFPGQLVSGKYLTQKDFVNVKPQALGAVKMRLASGAWENFAEKEFHIALPDFGTRKIIFEFESASGATKSAGVIVTRLPADTSELETSEAAQNSGLAKLRAAITTKLKKLVVWGISAQNEKMLATVNPAILPSEEVPNSAAISDLNAALTIAQEIEKLAGKENPAVSKIEQLAQELAAKNFKLDDLLPITTLVNIFGKISSADAMRLVGFLDLNSVALQKNDAHFTLGELSLGLRDSDDDGLADKLELGLGSNPFSFDSDGDGISDGDEVLKFGTDALTKNLPATVGFTNLPEKITSPRPFLTGTAAANTIITLVAVAAADTEITLGETITDTRGGFATLAKNALPAGDYELQIRENGETLANKNVTINLDFMLLPPQIFAGSSEIFEENQPAFYGNSFYDARVIAFFDDLPRAVVVDNTLGDFVVRPPKALALGKHTLTIVSELADGTRSPARVLEFETIKPNAKSAAPVIENFDWEKIALAGGILILAGIGGIWIFRRKNQTAP